MKAELIVERRPRRAVQAVGVERHTLEAPSLVIPTLSRHQVRLAASWDLARGDTTEQRCAAAIGERTPGGVHIQVATAQL